MTKNQPALPANRAFVVQLHADAQPEQEDFTGRVEHLVSMEAVHFHSVEELLALMKRILSAQQQAEMGVTSALKKPLILGKGSDKTDKTRGLENVILEGTPHLKRLKWR